MTTSETDKKHENNIVNWKIAYDKAQGKDSEGWVSKSAIFKNYHLSMPMAYRDFDSGDYHYFEQNAIGKRTYLRWAGPTQEEDDPESIREESPNVVQDAKTIQILPIGPYVIRTDGPVTQVVGLPAQGIVTLLVEGQTIQIIREW